MGRLLSRKGTHSALFVYVLLVCQLSFVFPRAKSEINLLGKSSLLRSRPSTPRNPKESENILDLANSENHRNTENILDTDDSSETYEDEILEEHEAHSEGTTNISPGSDDAMNIDDILQKQGLSLDPGILHKFEKELAVGSESRLSDVEFKELTRNFDGVFSCPCSKDACLVAQTKSPQIEYALPIVYEAYAEFSSTCFLPSENGDPVISNSSVATLTDYCEITPQHTLCRYSPDTVGPKCKQALKLDVTEEEKQEILHAHNKIRSHVARGEERRGQPGPQPPASNMLKLEWSDELGDLAQAWANQCIFQHDCGKCRQTGRFVVGQNIFIDGGTARSPADWEGAIDQFYEEVQYLNRDEVNAFEGTRGVGHYAQIVWGATQYIGCGFIKYKDVNLIENYYVCNYGVAGNFMGRPIYNVGRPCSECPAGTICSDEYPGLCTMEGADEIAPPRPDGNNTGGMPEIKMPNSNKNMTTSIPNPFPENIPPVTPPTLKDPGHSSDRPQTHPTVSPPGFGFPPNNNIPPHGFWPCNYPFWCWPNGPTSNYPWQYNGDRNGTQNPGNPGQPGFTPGIVRPPAPPSSSGNSNSPGFFPPPWRPTNTGSGNFPGYFPPPWAQPSPGSPSSLNPWGRPGTTGNAINRPGTENSPNMPKPPGDVTDMSGHGHPEHDHAPEGIGNIPGMIMPPKRPSNPETNSHGSMVPHDTHGVPNSHGHTEHVVDPFIPEDDTFLCGCKVVSGFDITFEKKIMILLC